VLLTSCTNKYRSVSFYIENVIYNFTKQASLIRRSLVLNLPLELEVPGAAPVSFFNVIRMVHNSEIFDAI
jgi:hypothetical protein